MLLWQSHAANEFRPARWSIDLGFPRWCESAGDVNGWGGCLMEEITVQQVDLSKTEYNFLLSLYIQLTNFEPWTSTFQHLKDTERQELLLTVSVLQRKMSEIMPRVQDREMLSNGSL